MHWQRYVHARQGMWPERLGYSRAGWDGERLRVRRRAFCWTTTELGALAGVSSRTIEAWEGVETVPDPETVAVLAHIFGCSFKSFFATGVEPVATPTVTDAAMAES